MMQPNQGGGLGGPSGVSPQSTIASMMTNNNMNSSTNSSSVGFANQNHFMAVPASAAGSITQMQQQQHQMSMPQPSPPGVRMGQQHQHQMAQFGMAGVGGHSSLSGATRPSGPGHPVFSVAQQHQQNQSIPSHLIAGQQHQQQIQISQAPSPSGPYTLMNSPQQRNPMSQQGPSNLGPFQQTSQPQPIIQRPPQLTQYAVVTNAMPMQQQQNPMGVQQQQQQFHPNQQPPNLSNSMYPQQNMQMQAQQQAGPNQGQMPRLPVSITPPVGGAMGQQNQQQQIRPMPPQNQPQQQQPQMPPGFVVHQSAPNQAPAPASTTQSSSSNVNVNLNLLSTQSSNASLAGPSLSNQLSQSSTLSGGSTQPAPSTADFDGPGASVPPLLTKHRLDDLTREIDPFEQLDDDVKEALLQYADEFIENVANSACQLAKHRKSSILEVQDVKLTLERNWNMWIPGFGVEDIRPYKKACVTEAHKQRMALIKKTLRKI